MQEIVLKRTANVTSAEALDQINEAHPDAEILSFRRIKEAGNDTEYFVARLRVAMSNDDVIVEDKQHEAEEESMLKEMLRLLRQLTGEEKKNDDVGVAELEDETNTLPYELDTIDSDVDLEGHERRPLPRPSSPPMGSMNALASVVAERPADVPEAVARIELMREFSHEYRIASIEREGDVYRATLVKRSAPLYTDPTGDPEEVPAHAGDAMSLLDVQQRRRYVDPTGVDPNAQRGAELMQERADATQKPEKPTKDEYGVQLQVPVPNFREQYQLSKNGYAWLNFLYEKGVSDSDISAEAEKLMQMSPQKQRAYIKSYIVDQDEFEQGRRDRATEKQQQSQAVLQEQMMEIAQLPKEERARAFENLYSQLDDDSKVALENLRQQKQLRDQVQQQFSEYMNQLPEEMRHEPSARRQFAEGLSEEERRAFEALPGRLHREWKDIWFPPGDSDIKDPRENPSKPIGFGDTPSQRTDQRSQRVDLNKRVNLPEGVIDDWSEWFGKDRPREDQELYPRARGLDIDGARQQLTDYFMQQVNNPDDETEAADAARLAQKELNRILGGGDAMRRLRKYPPKQQGAFLQRELRRALGEEERDKRVKLDPSRPFADTYKDMGSMMHPMQIANLLDQQMRLDRTQEVRNVSEVKRERPKGKKSK